MEEVVNINEILEKVCICKTITGDVDQCGCKIIIDEIHNEGEVK